MSHPPIATSIIIVRYFTTKLLGVTCGRLTSIYARTARLALHRHMNGVDVPYVERFTFSSSGSSSGEEDESEWKNIYGLGAGDTELILNVVPPIINNSHPLPLYSRIVVPVCCILPIRHHSFQTCNETIRVHSLSPPPLQHLLRG